MQYPDNAGSLIRGTNTKQNNGGPDMFDKAKLEEAVNLLGDLTGEQKALVNDVLENKIKESELFEKLGIEEEKINAFLKAAAKAKEEEVFSQDVSAEELGTISGGSSIVLDGDDDTSNCVELQKRKIYGGRGFPNCAATVESGSWCGKSDACTNYAVVYDDIHGCFLADCHKSWK